MKSESDPLRLLQLSIRYRRPSNTSVEVNTAVQMAVVCSEERRQELIEQRERLLTLEPRETE